MGREKFPFDRRCVLHRFETKKLDPLRMAMKTTRVMVKQCAHAAHCVSLSLSCYRIYIYILNII